MNVTEASEPLFLPPPFAARALGEGDPFAAACAAAAEAGAGALFLAERPGVLALAVVLEPEEPLAPARRAFPVAMAAVADALAAHCLPGRAVGLGWPDVLICDTGRIGGGRLGWPEGAAETAVPAWLVFGAELIADRDALPEPGRHPETTSLKEELFEDPRAIVESFARNLLYRMDLWQARGFEAAAEDYLRRLAGDPEGTRYRIGPAGDLLVRAPDGGVQSRGLLGGLAASDWRDPVRGGPRL